jgi:hypothetical protein
MQLTFESVSGISELEAAGWDALTDGSPLLSHRFLSTLETTGCIGPGTGWQACPLVVKNGDTLAGAVPLYAKSHSYGEYVFDWSWASAFEQHGLKYYPKLIAAVPFTPITGARLLSQDPFIRQQMAAIIANQLENLQLSSAHVLFPDQASADVLRHAGWLQRDGVQFRWENPGFANFDEFLARLTHDKRKKIRQERKKVRDAGLSIKRLTGSDISETDWDFFYVCYCNTYHQHASTPYLTREFFQQLSAQMADNVLLVIATLAGQPVAAALNLFGTDRQGISQLYGRYWGALAQISGLHFELCYYQAQEFCIERGIRFFEGGAQGEHKLARGFTPRPTCSFHKIADSRFAKAIEHFVRRESSGIDHYQHELEERSPFRRQSGDDHSAR